MKYSLAVIILLSGYLSCVAQSNNRVLFETTSKSYSCYVSLSEADAIIYKMGRYYDHIIGSAPAILSTDTLIRNIDGVYGGKQLKIEKINDKLFLIAESKKTRQLLLEPVKNVPTANAILNNAYYIGRYLKMNEELRKIYPLYNQSFRDRYLEWHKFQHEEMEYSAFRNFADKSIREKKDSISREHNKRTVLMNDLVQNMRTIDYNSLKDSLDKLSANQYSAYYNATVNEVAKQRPEYFFKLSENCSRAERDDIFYSVDVRDRETLARLKSVEGHDASKKSFSKNLRFRKVMPIASFGLVTAELAGIIWLLVILL